MGGSFSRRGLIAGTAAGLGASTLALPHTDPVRASRRIVTREAAPGRGEVAFRDATLPELRFNDASVTRFWETTGVPVALQMHVDAGVNAGNAYREGFEGTSLYIAEIPAHGPGAFVPMHREDSLDYIAVLQGEIHLLLDEEEILMKTGDVLVQGGNTHGWENRGTGPCRLLCVVMRTRSAGSPG